MNGEFVIVAVAVGGPLVGYGLGRWSALRVPVALCAMLAGLVVYAGSRNSDTGDDYSGLVAMAIVFVLLPVWVLTTSAGVWLSRRQRRGHR